ncbi:MAG: type II toxin-antitoxin system HicB family antitoxin [Deltaproteobacteria bacterium]|nr:type II toxin-antitoxin system HicB family antitoxin [Deltaproteobacteria bacterium]
MAKKFTAYIERDLETGLYVATVPGLSGAHTQAASLDELQKNLEEVLALILENMDERGEVVEIGEFVGIQQVEIAS